MSDNDSLGPPGVRSDDSLGAAGVDSDDPACLSDEESDGSLGPPGVQETEASHRNSIVARCELLASQPSSTVTGEQLCPHGDVQVCKVAQ